MTERDALYRAILTSPDDDTPRLVFADYLDENGEPDRASFVRVQVELARIKATIRCIDPRHTPSESGYLGCGDWVGVAESYLLLCSRERDLFNAHGAEWFGANATLAPPNERERRAPGWWCVVPARGFPSNWYGPWEAWVGRGCSTCAEGSLHHSGTPGTIVDVQTGEPYQCPTCHGFGRILGACETMAWRPGWEMECGTCKGRKHITVTAGNRCPLCNNPGRWRSGVGFEHEKICMSKTKGHPQNRSIVWEPGEPYELDCPTCSGSGRVPRPCPPGAVPLVDVTLTTMPTQSVFPQGRMEGRLEGCSQWHPIPRGEQYDHSHRGIAATLLAAEWPGLRFHLPGE